MSIQPEYRYPDLEAAIEGTLAPLEVIRQLELVDVDFVTFSYERKVGQLVVAKILAGEVQEIFGKIRDAKFPLTSVIPIVYFGHEDAASIARNNTSAFNYRTVAGTDRLSVHSLGRAIDINPWLNPYLNLDGTLMSPSIGDRSYDVSVPGTIVEGDAVVSAFTDRGWVWGGSWAEDHDYQHFDNR